MTEDFIVNLVDNNEINTFFKESKDKILYLTFNKLPEKIEEITNLKDFPVPSDKLIEGIKSKSFDEELNLSFVADGILLNLAIDKDFIYMDDYLRVLDQIAGLTYAKSRAIRAIKDGDEDKLLYARAAFLKDSSEKISAYNYARLLWRENRDREDFIKVSIKILENIYREDEKFTPASFELGEINYALGNYIKAKLYYEKSLLNSNIESVKEEIRTRLEEVGIPADIEDAIYNINKSNFERAIDILKKVEKQASRYDTIYYLGVCYMNLGDLPKAIDYFYEAEKYADFAVLYNDLIYCLYISGKHGEALDLANKAIEIHPTDIKIRYNRALLLTQENKLDDAKKDLDFILEYDDISDEVFSQFMELRQIIEEKEK